MSIFGGIDYLLVTVAMNKPDVTVTFEEPQSPIYSVGLVSAIRKKSTIPEDSDLLLYCDLIKPNRSQLGTEQVGENIIVSESNLLAILPWFLYEESPSIEKKDPFALVPSFRIWLRRMNGEKPVFEENDVFYICLKLGV